MYDYTYYDYGYEATGVATGMAAIGVGILIYWLIIMAVCAFTIICNWKVFTKAGKPGWAAIVPVYNIIVMLEMAELPLWYIVLFCIPIANIYATIKLNIELAHKFGKSTGFGVGMAFLPVIFIAILAFDKNVNYVGTQTQPTQPTQPQYQQPMQQPVQPQMQPEANPTVAPSFCTSCGSPLVPNSKFCTSCGKQI